MSGIRAARSRPGVTILRVTAARCRIVVISASSWSSASRSTCCSSASSRSSSWRQSAENWVYSELLIEAEPDEHDPVAVHLQLRALAKLSGVLHRQRGQPQQGGRLVNDLIGRILDIQPKGLARLNELRYQRLGGIPNDLPGLINPAPHGSRLRDSVRPTGRPRMGGRGQRAPGHRAVSLKRWRELLGYGRGVRCGPAQRVITDRGPGEERGRERRPSGDGHGDRETGGQLDRVL